MSVDASPFPLVWTDEGCFRPATPYWQSKADKRFVVGLKYLMVELQERSVKAHRHYFANLKEAFDNLPEGHEFADVEALRARALIMTGWREEEVTIWSTKQDAERFVKYRQRSKHELVVVNDNNVVVFRPKSQSLRAMGKKDFMQSKQDVLAWCWALVGVDPEIGAANAGRAA
jgi:hypothetical protein